MPDLKRYKFLDAQENDIEQLITLYKTCRSHSDMALVPDYFQSFPDSLFRNVWETHFHSPDLYKAKVAWLDEKPVGFCRTGPMDKEDYLSSLANQNLSPLCGELHQIYILPEHQKAGLGHLLYQHAVNDLTALGYKQFIICTYTENEKAKRFYIKMGAVPLKDDVLTFTFSGRLWHRPVSFFLGHV